MSGSWSPERRRAQALRMAALYRAGKTGHGPNWTPEQRLAMSLKMKAIRAAQVQRRPMQEIFLGANQ